MRRLESLAIILLSLLTVMWPLIASAQTSIDFDNLQANDLQVENHTGFSSEGIEQPDGFSYSVQGALKYVTPPGALYVGYRRNPATTVFTIANQAMSFVPHQLVVTNEFYLVGAIELTFIGYQAGEQQPVWRDTVTIGSLDAWKEVVVNLRPLNPPSLNRFDILPATPAGDLYFYLEGWSYVSAVDTDGDGVFDAYDTCPNTDASPADETGCSDSQKDTDGDGVNDALDACPGTQAGLQTDSAGCSQSQLDSDNDGVSDDKDQCPQTAPSESVDTKGCSASQLDSNGNGIEDRLERAVLFLILKNSQFSEFDEG